MATIVLTAIASRMEEVSAGQVIEGAFWVSVIVIVVVALVRTSKYVDKNRYTK